MKRSLYILFLICVGIVIGSLVATVTKDIQYLSYLSYGLDFGLTEPFILDLSVMKLTFGLTLHLNIAIVLAVFLSVGIGLRLERRRR